MHHLPLYIHNTSIKMPNFILNAKEEEKNLFVINKLVNFFFKNAVN